MNSCSICLNANRAVAAHGRAPCLAAVWVIWAVATVAVPVMRSRSSSPAAPAAKPDPPAGIGFPPLGRSSPFAAAAAVDEEGGGTFAQRDGDRPVPFEIPPEGGHDGERGRRSEMTRLSLSGLL